MQHAGGMHAAIMSGLPIGNRNAMAFVFHSEEDVVKHLPAPHRDLHLAQFAGKKII